MRPTYSRRRYLAAAALAGVTTLAGCGDGGDGATPDGAESPAGGAGGVADDTPTEEMDTPETETETEMGMNETETETEMGMNETETETEMGLTETETEMNSS